MKRRILIFLIISMVGLSGVYSMGKEEKTNLTDRAVFDSLPLDQQMDIYLKCQPITGSYPVHSIYETLRDAIIFRNPPTEVFDIAQKYFKDIDMIFLPGEKNRYPTVKDFRFVLLLDLFFGLSVNKALTQEQKDWLVVACEKKICDYIVREKRIDKNVVSVAYFIDGAILESVIISYYSLPVEYLEYVRHLYEKYINELQLVSEDEISIQDDMIFPGYNGNVVTR
jgi:hypothetical protein